MKLEPGEFSNSDYVEWESLIGKEPRDLEQWLRVAELAAKQIGLRRFVQIGDAQAWRHAVSEAGQAPLPPLNLPLSVWDAYLAAPFSSVTLGFADDTKETAASWSDVFYSWESRQLAIRAVGKPFRVFDSSMVSVDTVVDADLQPLRERLEWYRKANPFVPIVIRTKDKVFGCDKADELHFDLSGLRLVFYTMPEPRWVPLQEIVSVQSLSDCRAVEDQVIQALTVTPFRPFRIHFHNGIQWTIMSPQDVWIDESIFLSLLSYSSI